jgi:hypothetical protein
MQEKFQIAWYNNCTRPDTYLIIMETNFSIQFNYKDKEYKASVNKVISGGVHYLVSNLDPLDRIFPNPFMVSENRNNKQLMYLLDPKKYPPDFGAAIADAVARQKDLYEDARNMSVSMSA